MNRRRNRNQVRGFTLLEVLLVIAILGVLAGAVAFALGGTQEKQNINLARMAVDETLPRDIDRYKLENKGLPASLDAMVQAGVLKSQSTRDPWGQPYMYRLQGETYQLYSFGPNQADNSGGGDDISRTE